MSNSEISYIALDTEAAGNRLGHHATLSLGACLVARDLPEFDLANKNELIFYTEIQPESLVFVIEAMRVGCSHLKCLDEVKSQDSRYDTLSGEFEPELVLRLMQEKCEEPVTAMKRFRKWIESVSEGNAVEGVTDTVFFDGGRVDLLFGTTSTEASPFGWTGLDLDSFYRGHAGENAKISALGVPDNRAKPHRADHDAHLLAQVAQKLLFNKCGW